MTADTHPPSGHGDVPSAWITRFAHLVPAGARVLDLASGSGRHARLFAQRGCHVIAADRDGTVLAALRDVANITTEVVDLETGHWPFSSQRFDAIVVTNYLHRPLFPHLAASLGPDGTLLYETFAAGNEVFGRPANPDFLLKPSELLTAFADLMIVVAFEQGEAHGGGRSAVVERLAAVGRGRAWPPLLSPTDQDAPR